MNNTLHEEFHEDLLLRILSENYEAIYYVDYDKNSIKPYRMSDVIDDMYHDYFESSPNYSDVMAEFIERSVYELDKDEMYKRTSSEYLSDKLKYRRTYAYDFRVNANGERVYYRFKVSKFDNEEGLHKAAIGFADVTHEMDRINKLNESKAMLDLLEKDQLTGLYNKEFFFKEVERYLAEHPDEEFLFWTSDVQGMKIINEKYGMEVGDEILRIMSGRGGKYGLFPGFIFGGRVEGDKLSALMVDNKDNVSQLIKMLSDNMFNDYPVPNITVKHGLFHINKGCKLNAQGIYDRSMLALNSIRNKYGVRVAEYDDKLRKDLMIQRQVTEDAEDALSAGQFQVYYQPKHNIETGSIGGAEALVRWTHPELGFMSPGVFIPLFEQNGFITKLDRYIWEEVCKSIAEWKEKGYKQIPVSVNISRRDFEDPDLADIIIELVDSFGIEHSLFHIEVTESAYSDNPDIIVNTIQKLHDNGFVIELDDFGTGYSSMTALSKLDLDVMKLDMSLIQNDVPGTDKNVLEFSMQLAKMMKLITVAEGVETSGQADRIRSLGGDYIQGYLYSKPLDKIMFEEYLVSHS